MKALVTAVCLFALVSPAHAKGWPQPAAGESASGDIEILFTFDDGPNPKTTPIVLDVLKKHHIKAVFFLLGERLGGNKAAAKLVKRMLAEGHVIANHTMHHLDLCRLKTDEKAERDIDDGKKEIERVSGIQLAWFRTPYGARCDRVDRMLGERKLTHFHWDLDPQEWKPKASVEKTVKYVTTQIGRAGGRAVLLMHDIKDVTTKALPEILGWIDEENSRREKSRKSKVRILQAPAYAAEQLPKGFAAWLADATEGARTLPDRIASVLP
ncbi:MAG: polysaccharide deacetylase family protein [Kofleriaceae bacterium]